MIKLMDVEVHRDGEWVELYCTDKRELEWLFAELKKESPTWYIKYKMYLPSGELYKLDIRTDDREFRKRCTDDAIRWWIRKHLCSADWEPCGSSFGRFLKRVTADH